MTTLKYTGTAHFREIKKSDFSHHEGVEGEAIKVARHDIFHEQNFKKYPTAVEVSQETADWLVENEPGDWEVVEDQTAEEADTSEEGDAAGGEVITTPNASGTPSGSPDSPSQTPRASKTASSTRPR
jgi:hypothetical protein